jgi:hypothetical protein
MRSTRRASSEIAKGFVSTERRVFRVAGDEQHFQVRPQRLRRVGNLSSVETAG